MQGYIYILSNESMPGVVKIGRSERGGRSRAKELYATGVPKPFVLQFEIFTENSIELEAMVHEKMQFMRVSSKREFFKVNVAEAVQIVMDEYSKKFHIRSSFEDLIVHEDEIGTLQLELEQNKSLPHFFENRELSKISGDEIADALKNISLDNLMRVLREWDKKTKMIVPGCRRIESERNWFQG